MIKIQFRSIPREWTEIQMGHCIWGYGVPGVDCVSATAREDGFTPLNSVACVYGWDAAMVQARSRACNASGRVEFVPSTFPKLLLVPQTHGRASSELARTFVQAILDEQIRHLHMSHFGFIQNRFPSEEFNSILSAFDSVESQTTLQRVTVDVDSRIQAQARDVLYPYLRNQRLAIEASPAWLSSASESRST
jgi:hypothetical protein